MDRGDLLLLAALAIALFAMGWWLGYTGALEKKDRRYIECHLKEVGGGRVKKHRVRTSEWAERPFSVGDTVYQLGSFDITKEARFSDDEFKKQADEAGFPDFFERQYVIIKIK